MKEPTPTLITVFCGELCKSNTCSSKEINLLHRTINGIEANIIIGYDKFVQDPSSLPPRILDLLHIAAYVFCADRSVYRGSRDSISNNSWARSFKFHIPVIDIRFWCDENVQQALNNALIFMTGDRKYSFEFRKAKSQHYTQQSLFNDSTEYIEGDKASEIILFSGGLDSLAGIIEQLHSKLNNKLLLISHNANKIVTHTQNKIVQHLQEHYENRVIAYGFKCHNRNSLIDSKEETQRTRMFLFASIAFAICNYTGKHSFYVYENGITSINLPSQIDVINSRASRTTHPKTLGLMQKLFKYFDNDFIINSPYYNMTKEDILRVFSINDEKDLISSAVSCSSTRNIPKAFSHCGCCSQCIDRRFASYAAGLEMYDAEYEDDFIIKNPNDETRHRLYQILRLASMEKLCTPQKLYRNHPEEITDLVEYWKGDNPEDILLDIFHLFSRYSDSILRGAKKMQILYDDLSKPIESDSFLSMLSSREYLKTPIEIRVIEIDSVLRKSIPQLFHTAKPKNEQDFNDKVQAILTANGNCFTREYPVLKFGISSYRADLSEDGLIIESKYIRGKTSPSKASEGINADITQITEGIGVMFIVYDPERNIVNDDEYCNSYEKKRPSCYVRIYR